MAQISRRRFRTFGVAVGVGALFLGGCSGGNDDPAPAVSMAAIVLHAGTADDSSRPSAQAILEFAAQVRSRSGGKLIVEPVWEASGQDVRDWDQVVARKVTGGELDLGMIPARSWDTEGITSFQALQAPFLVTSDALLDQATTGDLAAAMLAGLDGHGVKGLTLIPEGLRHPFGFAKPLVAPADFAGKTIRTPRSQSGYALFKALGAKPDDLTGNEVTEALDNGSLAGYDNGYALAANLPAKATATGNLTFFPKANVFVINQKTLDTLPADQRAMLADAATRTREKMISERASDAAQAEQFCASGGKVVTVTDAQLRQFDEIAKPLYADLHRDPATRKLIEEIRALKKSLGASPAAKRCGK
jgi:TRAP-type C4-dicarboxylate transport system substrate-binding protein